MKRTKEEILNALQIIKDECKNVTDGNCRHCPFGTDNGDCLIQDFTPADWPIVKETEPLWRAFVQGK